MKKFIHPKWFKNTKVYCNGKLIKIMSSTKEILSVDIWSGNHPFFIKKKRYNTIEKQIPRFLKKYKLK